MVDSESRDGGQVNPWQPVKDFEASLCEYTGAPYAVAVNSCTAALELAVRWCHKHQNTQGINDVGIPKRTYVSVPCAIRNAGCYVHFRDLEWSGAYQLLGFPIWDCARRFTSGMYVAGQYQCVSFAAAKILGAEQGGAILHDNKEADAWFRRMRYDGRSEGVDPHEDTFDLIGLHCMMIPSVAALLRLRLHHLPKNNADLHPHDYPDLSKHHAFR